MSAYNIKPTKKDLKASLKKLKEDGGRIVHMDEMTKQLRLFIGGKVKSDIGITYHVGLGAMNVFNEQEMQEQMKLWKTQAKDGKLQVRECNNKTFEYGGKKFHVIVIQPTNMASCCPLAMSLGMMVSGWTYAYTKESNRDAVYQYVKKYCVAESDE
jgi:hypothetical protein